MSRHQPAGAGFDSFRIWVEDETGAEFMVMHAINTHTERVAAYQHRRWWMQRRRRSDAHSGGDGRGAPAPGPVGRCHIRVEFYNQAAVTDN